MANGSVNITLDEIHQAIRDYVNKKYGVESISSSINYTVDKWSYDMEINYASVTYKMKEVVKK